jgi:hypothetical protein
MIAVDKKVSAGFGAPAGIGQIAAGIVVGKENGLPTPNPVKGV